MTFDAKTPWFAFYNRNEGNALGVVNHKFNGVRRQGGPGDSLPWRDASPAIPDLGCPTQSRPAVPHPRIHVPSRAATGAVASLSPLVP